MKTAVDYIKEKLMCNEYWYENMTFDQIFEQAKEMEKEQIKNAWIATDNELQRIAAEEYYNRTYNL
jgi:hypothetical protein